MELCAPFGTMDYEPNDMVIRNYIHDTIKKVVTKFNIPELATPFFEHSDVLMQKYGPENNKQVFHLEEKNLTLRFDLTVPFARYVASKGFSEFCRFQHGTVARKDTPAIQKGRFCLFDQADIDFAGKCDFMTYDLQCLQIMVEVLSKLRFDFKIRINHKMFIDYILEICKVPQDLIATTCSSIDKLDKMSWDEIEAELDSKGLDRFCIARLENHLLNNASSSENHLLNNVVSLEDVMKKYPDAPGLTELQTLFDYAESLGILDYFQFDLTLIRGMDYYTHVIFEAVLEGNNNQYGSIAAGGRYDNLIGKFALNNVPAVGVAFGVERLFTILKSQEEYKQDENQKYYTKFVYITLAIHKIEDEEQRKNLRKNLSLQMIKVLELCRSNNVNVDFVKDSSIPVKAQLSKCAKDGYKWAIIIGQNELTTNTVCLRELSLEKAHKIQVKQVAIDDLIESLIL